MSLSIKPYRRNANRLGRTQPSAVRRPIGANLEILEDRCVPAGVFTENFSLDDANNPPSFMSNEPGFDTALDGLHIRGAVVGGFIAPLAALGVPTPGADQASPPHALAFINDDGLGWFGRCTGTIPGVGEPGGLIAGQEVVRAQLGVYGDGLITFVGAEGRTAQVSVSSLQGWQVVSRAGNFEVAPGVQLGGITEIRAETSSGLVVDDVTVEVTDSVQPEGGVIAGQKFLDLDADGARDAGEPGQDGWTIRLRDSAGNLIAEQLTAGIDFDGNGVIEPETERGLYRFSGL